MSLLSLIQSGEQTPTLQVFVNGVLRANNVSGTTDLGFDVVSAKAVVIFDDLPSYTYNGTLEIKAGYGGLVVTVFKGFIEDKEDRWFPHDRELHGAGRLKRAQYQYAAGDWPYASQTDDAVVRDLLSKSGINGSDIGQIDSAGVTLGTVTTDFNVTPNLTTCTLARNQAPWDLINEIDQMLNYKTFDTPQGTVQRKLILAIPSSAPVFNYVENDPSYPILSLSGPATVSTIHNQVNITGYSDSDGHPADGATQTSADWPVIFNAPNSLVPNPPQYISFPFNSQLIETLAVAENAVGPNMSLMYNRVVQEVTIEVPGNPLLRPGDSIGINSANGECSGNYFVEHVTHDFQPGSFITRIKAIGGGGVAGSIAPSADFDVDIRSEVDGVGVVVLSAAGVGNAGSGSGTAEYDVFCNAKSATSDPLYPDVTQLTFHWSNSSGVAGTSNGPYYSFQLTSAQLAANPTVSLYVTDPTGVQSTTITKTLNSALFPSFKDPFVGTDTIINVAALNQAECTTDGGLTWYGYKPTTGHIVSTPERGALIAGYSLFGSDDGKLYLDASNLVSPPVDVSGGSFGSHAINCMYVHSDNPHIVLVGLDNGELWINSNASKTASDWTGNWRRLFVFADPVNWCVITGNAPYQMFVSMSNQMLTSADGGATWTEGFGLGGDLGSGATCYRLSYYPAFENTFAGTASSGTTGLQTTDDTVHTAPGFTAVASTTGGSLHDPNGLGGNFMGVAVGYVNGISGDIGPDGMTGSTNVIPAGGWASTTTGSIVVTPPSSVTGATHYYVYAALHNADPPVGPCQAWGSPTPLGTSFTITTLPTNPATVIGANLANVSLVVNNHAGGPFVAGDQLFFSFTAFDVSGKETPVADPPATSTQHVEVLAIPTGTVAGTVSVTVTGSGLTNTTGWAIYCVNGGGGVGALIRQQSGAQSTALGSTFIVGGSNSISEALVRKTDAASSGIDFTLPPLSPLASFIKGLTHDAENDALYCGDDQGRTFKGSTATQALTQQGTLPTSPGAINHMVSVTNTPPSPLGLLAAAVGGLYKSIDDGVTWVQIRAYNGTTMQGKMVGYADLITSDAVATIFLSGAAGDTGTGSTYVAAKSLVVSDPPAAITNAKPSGWQNPSFVDTSWTTISDSDGTFPSAVGQKPFFNTDLAHYHGIWNGSAYQGSFTGAAEALFRHSFMAPAGPFSSINLIVNVSDAGGCVIDVYLNGSLLTTISGPPTATTPLTSSSAHGGQLIASLPATALLPGATNVLAIDAKWTPTSAFGAPGIAWAMELS